MESPRRIRLVFEEANDDRLKRSWILLRPHLLTFSDLCSYLLDSFLLHHYFPHGLTLTMDGFLLPPFESISLLKDNDTVTVSVKKKEHETIDDEDEAIKFEGQTDRKPVCRKRKALCTSKKMKKNNHASSSTARCVPTFQDQSFQQDIILPVLETTLVQQQTINLDFSKLRPWSSMPKKGDIIAYRYFRVSSTWKPYLSSLRVGKVRKIKGQRMKLNSVPEYRFVFKVEMNGKSVTQVADDGCLIADYFTLHDTKIVKLRNSKQQVYGNENAWDEILPAMIALKTE